jgi:hypothetical protein
VLLDSAVAFSLYRVILGQLSHVYETQIRSKSLLIQSKLKVFDIVSQMLDLAVQNTFTESKSKGTKVYGRAQLALAFIDTAV